MRWRAEEAAWCDRGETRLRRPGPRFSREDSPLPLRHWSFYCKRLVFRNICQVKKRRIVETRLSIFLFTGSLREGGCNQLLIMELSLLLGLLQFYHIRGGFTFKAKDEFSIQWWDVLQEVWLLTGLNGGHMTVYLVPGKRKYLGNYLSIEIQIQRPRNLILGQKIPRVTIDMHTFIFDLQKTNMNTYGSLQIINTFLMI